jgi:hypothetical protein
MAVIDAISSEDHVRLSVEIRHREPAFPRERFEASNPTLTRKATPERDDAFYWVSWEAVQLYLRRAAEAHRRSDRLVVHARPGFNLWNEPREVAGSNGRMHHPSQIFITFRTLGNRKPYKWAQSESEDYAILLEEHCGGHYAALPELSDISDIFVYCKNASFMWHHPWAGWRVVPEKLKIDIKQWPGDKLIYFDGGPAHSFEEAVVSMAAAGPLAFFRVGVMGGQACATIARQVGSDEWFFATSTEREFHRVAGKLNEIKPRPITGDAIWSNEQVNKWNWPLLWTAISWRYFEDSNLPPDYVGLLKTADID